MKYCEYCGKAISDNAAFCSGCGKRCESIPAAPVPMFCENCGRPLEADERFCQGCGTPAGGQAAPAPAAPVQAVPAQPIPQAAPCQPVPQMPAQPVAAPAWEQPVQPAYNAPAPAAAKKRKMPKWVLAVTAVVLVAAIGLGIFALCGGFIKRADLPNPLTLENLAEFLNVVVKNAEGDYVCYAYDYSFIFLADPNIPEDEALYAASTVQIRVRDFLNGKLKLKNGYVSIHVITGGDLIGKDSKQYSKEQYDRSRDVIIALEKTLVGKAEADNYLKSYSEMQKQVATMEAGSDGAMQITYQLNEKLDATIVISRTTSYWSLSYNIKVKP